VLHLILESKLLEKELGSDPDSSYDRLEHYGGEEFLVMASGCSWNGAMTWPNELVELSAQNP
jgi:hypothetical protein